MATWAQFEEASPDIAAVGRALLEKHQLAYLATIRPDGAPRLHPVSPFIIEGTLLVSTPPSSPKVRDQQRDGRYVLHMLPGDNDDEFSVRGRASLVTVGNFQICPPSGGTLAGRTIRIDPSGLSRSTKTNCAA